MDSISQSPIFAAFVLIASSSVVSSIATAWFSRKNLDASMTKTKADAAKTLSDTAIAQTQLMAAQIGELRQALRMHREWDKKMVIIARQAGLEIDDPPELWL
ncbi:hypothetical protein AB4305_33385 [Nocardia sp. 2YAB30]|uniref:hypothetical protein n=1 Tax=Nocardia sp. 2YAB30 TaxID=3233022 RepID=UPI003F95178E